MALLCLTFVSVFLIVVSDDPPTKDPVARLTIKEPALRQELLQRVQEDQAARKEILAWMKQQLETQNEAIRKKEVAVARIKEIDRLNTNRLKEIVAKHGWPGQTLVGKDGAQAAWLLVQHADHDRPFQRRCLDLLTEAVKHGEAAGQDLAYLTDRVRVGENKKQIYGTQFQQVDGKMEPYPIEDEANVDKRRREVGLTSLAEYRKLIEDMSKPKSKARTSP